MSRTPLREAIAREAARLILRGKENEYATARKRAARWLSRRRVSADDMPSNGEIQTELFALAGWFREEHEAAELLAMRQFAARLLRALDEFRPRLQGSAVSGSSTAGAEIRIRIPADALDEVVSLLRREGFRPRAPVGGAAALPASVRVRGRFPVEIVVGPLGADEAPDDGLDNDQLEALLAATSASASEYDGDDLEDADDEAYHPEAFDIFRALLERLESVSLDPADHPEGDALYHSLQVYELGLAHRPYDEEFLLACLLHDVGLGLDRRRPIAEALSVLGELITERTRFLIEHHVTALDYLRTGQVPRSLRRSEHFDDLTLLARCDREGHVPGARVSTVDEALDYIAGLETSWDDV